MHLASLAFVLLLLPILGQNKYKAFKTTQGAQISAKESRRETMKTREKSSGHLKKWNVNYGWSQVYVRGVER